MEVIASLQWKRWSVYFFKKRQFPVFNEGEWKRERYMYDQILVGMRSLKLRIQLAVDDLQHQNTEAVDVGLGGENTIQSIFWRHVPTERKETACWVGIQRIQWFLALIKISTAIFSRKNCKHTYYVPTTVLVVAWPCSPVKILAIPKSEILGFICSSNSTFAALRSRWTTLSREPWWR